MKKIKLLLQQYILTLLTLVLILCLTFYKPTGLVRTDTIIGVDKLVHFVMYFTLCAVFWYESFKVTITPKKFHMAVFAVILPIIFSGVMEYLQYLLTSYRTGDFDDFVFNTTGVLAAMAFSLFVTRPYMVARRKK
jgi:VanZ family protein